LLHPVYLCFQAQSNGGTYRQSDRRNKQDQHNVACYDGHTKFAKPVSHNHACLCLLSHWQYVYCTANVAAAAQARRESGVRGVSYHGSHDVCGPLRQPECTILKKKFQKIQQNFSPERNHVNVWGPRENVSPGSASTLDGPAAAGLRMWEMTADFCAPTREFYHASPSTTAS